MATVVRLHPDIDRPWLTMPSSLALGVVPAPHGQSVREGWKPLRVKVLADVPLVRDLPPTDFPKLGMPPVFSARAVERLLDLLLPHGELLKLSCPEGSYRLYNVTRVLDALDVEHSELER